MYKEVVFFLILLLFLIFLYFLLLFYLKKKSKTYQKVKELNRYYYFYIVPKKIIIKDYVLSKKRLFSYDFNMKIYQILDNNSNNLTIYLKDIHVNRKNYKSYLKEYQKIIMDSNSCFFIKYLENLLCKKIKLNPCLNFLLKTKAIYQGKIKYKLIRNYYYDDLLVIVQKLKDVKKRKQFRRKLLRLERQKLSDGLRYDILKRDNFRCQICGSTSSSGVLLHVDHIIPISKGGKTVSSNLQTLCERCNLGKSNKL